MFAPPPIATLSRAEIQTRRAQLQAKRASSETSISSASELQRADSNPEVPKQDKKKGSYFSSSNKKDVEEIRETDKEEWKVKKKLSRKGKSVSVGEGGSGSSLPATLLLPPPIPPGPPSLKTKGGSDAGSFIESVSEGRAFASSPLPTEWSRKAAPPKRPARPSEDLLSPPLSASTSGSFPRALTPESFAGNPIRSASTSPATSPPFKAPPPVPGEFPMLPTSGSMSSSLKPPPLPSPPMMTSSLSLLGPTSPPPSTPPPSTPPPPVPQKSPLRQQRTSRLTSNSVKPTDPVPTATKKQHSMSTDAALSTAMSELRMAMKDPISTGQAAGEQHHQRLPHAAQMSVLTEIKPLQVCKPLKSPAKSLSRSGTGSSAAGVGVVKSRSQRIVKQGLRRQEVTHHRRGGSRDSVVTGAQTPTQIVTQKPRRLLGETMTMLQTSGFFPETTDAVGQSEDSNVSRRVVLAMRCMDKDLPDNPNSIAPTPTELYQSSRNSFLMARKSRAGSDSSEQSPLSAIADTDAKPNNPPASAPQVASTLDDVSPHRLTTILEYKALSENSPPPSGTATPIVTQIHLQGGSVVTVTPPEMTAWQRFIYIQGPVRLPKPVILPRKDSVASMEPFQEAIDWLYQNALFVPRRRSDDAIVDDVLEFFDDFGFTDIGFGSDLLAIQQAEGATEDDTMDVDEVNERIERSTTPSGFSPAGDVSQIEKVVAKDVVEASMTKAILFAELPPVDNEETLRAREIARLSQ